jgi:hypothetical protein
VESPKYVSAIPRDARERVIGRHPDGTKRTAEYRLGRDRVGLRCFFESGEPERECGMRRGKKHGTEYDWPEKRTQLELTGAAKEDRSRGSSEGAGKAVRTRFLARGALGAQQAPRDFSGVRAD